MTLPLGQSVKKNLASLTLPLALVLAKALPPSPKHSPDRETGSFEVAKGRSEGQLSCPRGDPNPCSWQVCPRSFPVGTGRGGSSSSSSSSSPSQVGAGVFVSISAETVAASGRVLVAARSLQVDVSLSEVPKCGSLLSPSQVKLYEIGGPRVGLWLGSTTSASCRL